MWVGDVMEMHRRNTHKDSALPGRAVRKRNAQTKGRKKSVAEVVQRTRTEEGRDSGTEDQKEALCREDV